MDTSHLQWIEGPPPSLPFRGVRLELTKEATEGCFLECNRMRSRVSEEGHGNGMKWRSGVRHTARISLILPNYTTLTSLPHYTALRHVITIPPCRSCRITSSYGLFCLTASSALHRLTTPSKLRRLTDSLLLLHYQLSPNLSYHPY